MIQDVLVEVEARETLGKNACRRLRRAGRIPGVVYGLSGRPLPVAVSPKRLDEVLRLETGQNTVLSLSLAGEDRSPEVMIKELQRDPVTDRVIHVDFVRVDPNRSITVSVPVRLIGTPIGVKQEMGLLDFVLRHVEVECLPKDIPEHLDLDVSELHLNQHAEVSALKVAERVRILVNPNAIVAVVVAPKAEAEAAPAAVEAAAEAPAEPVVIKKGKEEAPEAESKND